MIESLIIIYVTLIIPISILFFENKDVLNDHFITNFTLFYQSMMSLPILIALYYLIQYFDVNNIPSQYDSIFVGKRKYIDIILIVFTYLLICSTFQFYISYYKFKKLSKEEKVKKIFSYLVKKLEKIEIRNGWHELHEKIQKNNDESEATFFSEYVGKRNYKTSEVGKVFNKVILKKNAKNTVVWIYPGKEIRNVMVLYRADRKMTIGSVVKYSSVNNYEIKILDLLEVISEDAFLNAKDGKYDFLKQRLRLLSYIYNSLIETDLILNYIEDFIRHLLFTLKRIRNYQIDDSLKAEMISDFAQEILQISIRSKDESIVEFSANIGLNKELIEIEDKGIINKGFSWHFSMILEEIKRLPEKFNVGIRNIIYLKVLSFINELDENKREIVLTQLRDSYSYINENYNAEIVTLILSFFRDAEFIYYTDEIKDFLDYINNKIIPEEMMIYLGDKVKAI